MELKKNISALGSAAPLELSFLRDKLEETEAAIAKLPKGDIERLSAWIIQKYQADWTGKSRKKNPVRSIS